MTQHIVLAITGATGSGFGVAALKRLAGSDQVARVSFLVSPTGRRCLLDETGLKAEELASASEKIHLLNERDLGSGISSGSHLHNGMVIVPCSAGTLGRIAAGTSENLIGRAADVCLKERRRVVLMFRETPLHAGHIRLMQQATLNGAIVMPPVPGFYSKPKSIVDLVTQSTGRALDLLGIDAGIVKRWKDNGAAAPARKIARRR
jgi:4-hydroxy-3-polyprenylbenzoate decarboxylase